MSLKLVVDNGHKAAIYCRVATIYELNTKINEIARLPIKKRYTENMPVIKAIG